MRLGSTYHSGLTQPFAHPFGSLAALVALAVVATAIAGCGKGIESTAKEAPQKGASKASSSEASSSKKAPGETVKPSTAGSTVSKSLGSWSSLKTVLPRSYKVMPTATSLGAGQILVWGHEPAAKGLVLDVGKDVVAREVEGRFPRREHAAVRLADGKVLISGGVNVPKNFYVIKSAVLFDPVKGEVAKTESMLAQRRGHSAHLGPDGKAYVIAGMAGGLVPPTKNIDQYDPATAEWKVVGRLQRARFGHSTAVLSKADVLVVGGHDRDKAISTLEVCTLGDKTTCKALPLGSPRDKVRVAALTDGKALILGGYKLRASDEALVFDNAGFKTERTAKPRTARNGHVMKGIGQGRVLVVGGTNDPRAEAEIFDVDTGEFRECGRTSTVRIDGSAIRLNDGRVVVVGGTDAKGGAVTAVDIWTPGL